MIEIENVSKKFKGSRTSAIQDLNLSVSNGEVLGLVGLNGAGKTTTLRLCSGVLMPTSGKIIVDGIDLSEDKREASRNIGWVPEQTNFNLYENPISLMRYYSTLYGMDKDSADRIIINLLSMVGLESKFNKISFLKMSQGMKKRFMIAVALLSNPENILLDETINGLDPNGIKFVIDLIKRLRDEGKTIVLSSHILKEVEAVSDRVAIIHKGKLVKLMTKEQISLTDSVTVILRIENPDKALESVLGELGDFTIDGKNVILKNVRVPANEVYRINGILVSHNY
ncbi:MAG: ABC transporter ATP-binding protein, partial [Candidatus Thermoplasmatota archaeon]|nr:ABC transporter ATP-binding protein [Candidatus Thermoplasmatota archaeon]